MGNMEIANTDPSLRYEATKIKTRIGATALANFSPDVNTRINNFLEKHNI